MWLFSLHLTVTVLVQVVSYAMCATTTSCGSHSFRYALTVAYSLTDDDWCWVSSAGDGSSRGAWWPVAVFHSSRADGCGAVLPAAFPLLPSQVMRSGCSENIPS